MKRVASVTVLVSVLLISVSCSSEKDQVAEKIRQIVAEQTGGKGKIIEMEISEASLKPEDAEGGVTEVRLSGGKTGYVVSIILDVDGNAANIISGITRDKPGDELDYSALRQAIHSF